jgi:tetratricopeptide (TPR) repeat protein
LRFQPGRPAPPAISPQGLEPAVWTALEESRREVSRSPNSSNAWGHLGKMLLAHKFAEEAGICFARAEMLDPTEPRWPYFQGIILDLTDTSAAIAEFQRSVDLCDNQPDGPRLKLAEALLQQGQSPEAGRQYELLLRDNPSHPLAHLGLARLAFERNAWQEALSHVHQALTSPFTRKAAHALLAAIHERQGNRASAEKEASRVAELPADLIWPDPYSDELVQLRVDRMSRFQNAARLLEENQPAEAEAALLNLVREFPDMDMAWRTLGFAQLQTGNYAAAEQSLKAALKVNPDSVEALYYLGCVAAAQKKHELAKVFLLRAIELKPGYARAQYQLALSLKDQGDWKEAIEALRAALKSRPNLAEAHRDLGEILARTGQTKDARDHLRQALELNPGDHKTKELLERLNRPR